MYENDETVYPNYTNLKIINHNKTGPIYVFDNFLIDNNNNQISLSGSWMIIPIVPFYGHFLQEKIGPLLYYRKYINSDVNVLWIDSPPIISSDGHEMNKTYDFIKGILKTDKDIVISFEDFGRSSFLIEKFISFFNSNRFIPKEKLIKNFVFSDTYHHYNNGINPLIRNMLSPYMFNDPTKPKKIFASRKKRSMLIENFNESNVHFLRYSPIWYHEAVETFFENMGYEIIEFSNLTLPEQISYFYNADIVAGISGAAMLNGIFCKNNTKFEIILSHIHYNYSWQEDIESVIDAQFKYIELYDTISYNQVYEDIKISFERTSLC